MFVPTLPQKKPIICQDNIDLKENNIVFCLNKQGIYNVINVKVTRKYPILGIFNNYEYQCLEFNSPKANLSYSLLQTIVNKLNDLIVG